IKALAYVSPQVFLKEGSRRVIPHNIKDVAFREVIVDACELASQELCTQYYGDMCPGYFNALEEDNELIEREYDEFYRNSIGIINLFRGDKCTDGLKDILDTFEKFSEMWPPSGSQATSRDIVSPNQLPLPLNFDD